MKIFGIGIDIVNINRIAKSIKQKKFTNKLIYRLKPYFISILVIC